MIGKLIRYYHTLKHLKPIQIRYQVWYRLQDKFFPVKVTTDLKAPNFQEIKMHPFPSQDHQYMGDKSFRLLNLEHSFEESIDWNYSGYGKLWTYHLNYFDFLHQSGMNWGTGKYLMDDFLSDIKHRKDGMEPYPISLRTINYIKFLAVHKRYPQEIVDALYAQYQILIKKLEYHLLGNHLLENGFSLLFGAVLFQYKKMEKLTRNILLKELDEQILDDGAHFELSPMYHVILLQRALDSYNLLLNNDHNLREVEECLAESIRKMVNWLFSIQFSNGDIPMLNDSTPGQALEPDIILDYARELGFQPEKIQLKESGYRKFENGAFELVADVGEVGPSYQPGHAHADCLNFVLHYDKKPVIVDRGISTYEKNELREEERGTSSHNTVVMHNQNQSDVWGGFRVGRRAIPILITDNEFELKASHTGYDHLGASHEREWKISKDQIVIEDIIKGTDESATAYLHFHPDVKIENLDEQTFRTESLIFSFSNSDSVWLEEYRYCEGFNRRRDAFKLNITFSKELKTKIFEPQSVPAVKG